MPSRSHDLKPSIWLRPEMIFDGQTLLHDVAIEITNGHVASIKPISDAPKGLSRIEGTLSSGFIDLQVNGGGDVMVNTTPTPGGIATICAAHRKFGTVGILPTIITDAPEVMHAAGDAVLAGWGKIPGLLGLHIEGPHLSMARRGTHSVQYLRKMDYSTIALVTKLRAAEIPVMITLAPEAVGDGDISRLAKTGAVVSLGHTDTDSLTTCKAVQQGARAFTHLFNAMSPMQSRAPGVVGAAINSTCHTGLICDGIHVDDAMIELAIRARPEPDLCFLVSDAMPTIGGSKDGFELYGTKVHLKGGKLTNSEGGLAGAHLTQAMGLHRLINVIGVEPSAALRMVTSIPAHLMGLTKRTSIIGQAVDDLIMLDQNFAFKGYANSYILA